MAYLGKYIRQILSRQESVVFPGFGSLILVEGKGVRGADGRIDPPGPVIRFDATHPKGDGKLAEEYAAGEKLDLEEARQQVLELVDAIKFKLDKGEKYEIQQTGTFMRDDDNKVHFIKHPGWVIDPEVFGLASLDILELENEEDIETEKEDQLKAEETREAIEASESTEDPVAKRVQRKPVNKWKIIWIVIGSLIAVLTIILLIPSDNGVEFGKDGIVIRDKDINKAPVQKEPADQTIDEPAPEVKEIPIVPPVEENRYFIIAGSFEKLPNASELTDKLKAKGFPAEIIITESRMYRVSLQSYATREEALADLSRVRSASGMPSAWLMVK
jgi:cell division protein FtsN/nucleoid DNA-binding protein